MSIQLSLQFHYLIKHTCDGNKNSPNLYCEKCMENGEEKMHVDVSKEHVGLREAA